MRARHSAVARYHVYRFDPAKPRGKQKTVIESDLAFNQARSKADSLNAELRAKGKARFADPLYNVALTNAWACLSDAARARHISLGRGPEYFNR